MTDQFSKIERTLGRLEEGVSGINKRLDVLNNSVAKSKDKINELETFKDNLQGRIIILVAIVGVLISVISSYLKDIVNFFMR